MIRRCRKLIHLADDDEYIPRDAQISIVYAFRSNQSAEVFVYASWKHALCDTEALTTTRPPRSLPTCAHVCVSCCSPEIDNRGNTIV